MSELVTVAEIESVGPWLQKVTFPSGVTVGKSDVEGFIRHLTETVALAGKSVIDVGCNAGMTTLHLERAGATVWAFDNYAHWSSQFELVKRALNLQACFNLMSIYDLDRTADVVFMAGVYYHLRHPLLGLERAWAATREVLLVEGEILNEPGCSARFVAGEYNRDSSNWWIPTIECLEDWCRSLPLAREIEVLYPVTPNPHRAGVRVWR